LTTLVEFVRPLLRDVGPADVGFDGFVVGDEAIALPMTPVGPVDALRDAARIGVASVLATGDDVMEDAARYRPHVSVGYFTAAGSAAPYIDALRTIDQPRTAVRISHVDLIEMHRDTRMYQWRAVEQLPLGSDH